MIQPIVLAAGLGTRLGSVKALVSIDGRPALEVVLGTIAEVGLPPALVVLGHDADAILQHVPLHTKYVVINPQPEDGIGSSLRYALAEVPRTADGILVFHVDMPYVRPSTVRSVLSAVRSGATLAAPVYRARRGFPVFFAQQHLNGLHRTLTGDRGGHPYLTDHEDALVCVAVHDHGCVRDIDHPEDLPSARGEISCSTYE